LFLGETFETFTLGVAVADMERLAGGARFGQAGHRADLASTRVPPVLEVKSRFRTGRPATVPEVRGLIRRMAAANPRWGAPRIHGELQTVGISVSQATVAKLCLANNPTAVRTSTQTTHPYEDALSSDDDDNDGERWPATIVQYVVRRKDPMLERQSTLRAYTVVCRSPLCAGGPRPPRFEACAVANVMLNDMLAR
jgi:hypothetical protein